MINDIRGRMSWIGSVYIGDTLDTLGIPWGYLISIGWVGKTKWGVRVVEYLYYLE